MYDATKFTKEEDIILKPETIELLRQANEVFEQNFEKKIWYGRCIFFSWYCKLATCKFCYRSTLNHKNRHDKNHHRSIGSMLTEALLCKVFNWRIEFLTGGYQEDNDFDTIVLYTKLVSQVYGERIWVNVGWMTKEQIELLRPYVKGICASIETATPQIHKFVCPHKPIKPYEKMFKEAQGFQKSAAFIVGLGDTQDDLQYWFDFIEKYDLQRITVYALKPVKNGYFDKGPSTEEYLIWLAKLRIQFPKLQIICGTNLRRCEEIGYAIQAGVNAITKFPATKQFGTDKANKILELVQKNNREFISNITYLPDIDWENEIQKLQIDTEYKDQIRNVLPVYLKQLKTY